MSLYFKSLLAGGRLHVVHEQVKPYLRRSSDCRLDDGRRMSMYDVVISEPEGIGCRARSWIVKLVESKRQDVAGRQLNRGKLY